MQVIATMTIKIADKRSHNLPCDANSS